MTTCFNGATIRPGDMTSRMRRPIPLPAEKSPAGRTLSYKERETNATR